MSKALKADVAGERSINRVREHDEYNEVHESSKPVGGFYDNPAKNKCRSKVISHAIKCLTTERYNSACVKRGHVGRVWQQLQESGKSGVYFDPPVIETMKAEILRWEILHDSKIQFKKPSYLNVCYLGGESPINDLEVLVKYGVLPQNVWAVEKDPKKFEKARQAIRGSRLRNVRLFKGDILDFLRDYEGNFDIIYFDACGTLPSAKQTTLKFIGYVFQYNKLTSPGALITNFSFPPKIEPTECDEEAEKQSDIKEEMKLIKEFVNEYLKYRLVNTWMNKGSPEQNAKFLDQRTEEENYGDYITYQIIDSAYLYIPALRMLSSTKSNRSTPLWDQMLKKKNFFLQTLKKCETSFDGVTESSSASEETVANESFGASTASASNAGDDSFSKELSIMKSISIDSPLRNCGHALEDKMQANKFSEAWVGEILPDWKSTPNLKNQKLQFLLLTHLLSYFDDFISAFTKDNFQKQCIEPLVEALHSDNDQRSSRSVHLSNTSSLVAGLLYGQMAYPSFPVVDKMLRLCYTGTAEEGKLRRRMFTDVFIFDQCRYVYQQFPSIDCVGLAITKREQPILFRMVVDGLREHLEDICLYDVFPSCHVASIDPLTPGGTHFPNSRPRIPERKEVNLG